MQGVLDWLSALPVVALYAMMFLAAAIENIFPPIPADTIVAFGSFLAARGQGTILGAFLAVWIGNLAGAAVMYAAGRRYGASQVEKRLLKDKGAAAEGKLRTLYERYGIGALFLSRFVPGVRAIVPPFAGALRLSPVSSLAAIAIASGVWYGLVSYIAFRAGADWNALMATIALDGRIIAIGAAVVIGIGALVWWLRQRRRVDR